AGGERGRGGLAVGAGDGDATLEPHELGQHLRARNHRDALRARFHQLGVVFADGAGHHHAIGAEHVGGRVVAVHGAAQLCQPAGHGVIGPVRARHLVAQRAHHLGDATHAGATDTDEVHAGKRLGEVATVLQAAANGTAHAACSGLEWGGRIWAMTMSATRAAASGRASERAAWARRSRSARSARISSVAEMRRARSVVSALCGNSCAPPRSTMNSALWVWWSSTACGNGTSTLPTPAAHS